MLMYTEFSLPVRSDGESIIHIVDMGGYEVDFEIPIDGDKADAIAHAINAHDQMAELLSSHREFFEGILEHAPKDTPIDSLDIYHNMILAIDEVLGNV